ncbi:hypothetical protein [Lysinibacillus sphaericus]|uniref:hypothetical protein n=1 Tax=Lysinibacillus sphaericus TaxID=1421 RepID=UPI001F512B44|nr:hypothetical protein [Lysinibacillus sphaericus]
MIKEVRNQELIAFILSGELMKFYKSKEWMDLRLDALKRDNYECQSCKAAGRYHMAENVHHFKNGLEEDLKVNQYNEIKKELNLLKDLIANKANLHSLSEVASTHKGAWEWAIKEGIIKEDGKSTNSTAALTHEHMATMLKRYHDKYVAK